MVDEKGNVAIALLFVIIGLTTILIAFSLVAYPIFSVLYDTATATGLFDEKSETTFNNSVIILGAVGIIMGFGLFVWFLATLTKKEEYEWE